MSSKTTVRQNSPSPQPQRPAAPTHPASSQEPAAVRNPATSTAKGLTAHDIAHMQRAVGNQGVRQFIRQARSERPTAGAPASQPAPNPVTRSGLAILAATLQRQVGPDAEIGQVVVHDSGTIYTIIGKEYDKALSQIVYRVRPAAGGPEFLVPDDNRRYHWETYIDPDLEADDDVRGLFRPGMTLAEVEAALNTVKERGVMYEIGVVFKNGRLRRIVKGEAAGKNTQAVVKLPKLMNDGNHAPVPIDPNGSVMTHNHPVGYPLSSGDIAGAVVCNMEEIRAVGLTTFSMKRSGKTWGIPFKGKGNLANFEVLDVVSAFWRRLSWPEQGLKALGLRNWVVAIDGRKIDLADTTSSFFKAMDHYWFLQNLARDKGWQLDDGLGNDIRAYARLALKTYAGVDRPERIIP